MCKFTNRYFSKELMDQSFIDEQYWTNICQVAGMIRPGGSGAAGVNLRFSNHKNIICCVLFFLFFINLLIKTPEKVQIVQKKVSTLRRDGRVAQNKNKHT